MSPRRIRAPRSLRQRARVWLSDYAYALAAERSFAQQRSDPGALEKGFARPVLLIPGVYETWEYLLPVARALNEAGHPTVVVPGLERNRVPIPEAARLASAVLRDRDLRDVVIVAHSKGGLIAKHVLALGDPDGRVAGVVAIASPFQGSSLSRLPLTRPLREFAPGRGSIAALAAEKRVNEHIWSIYPEYDIHIPSGSELPGATNISLPLSGHFRVLADPLVIEHVLRAVSTIPARV
jgi:pimeloyl-ACP methyl ester carboxylesterase